MAIIRGLWIIMLLAAALQQLTSLNVLTIITQTVIIEVTSLELSAIHQ